MADPAPLFEGNNGTQGTPSWADVIATGEVRWADSEQVNIGNASWPNATRPASTPAIIQYMHAYSADAVGRAICQAAFARANYNAWRWRYTAGTFAGAPICTAYTDNTHIASPSRNGHDIVTGDNTDTLGGGLARSYLKAMGFGRWTTDTPGAGPGADPVATDGTTGAVTTPGSASWSAWQGLMAEVDWLACNNTPGSVGSWYLEMALFSGPNMTPGNFTAPKVSLKYLWQ